MTLIIIYIGKLYNIIKDYRKPKHLWMKVPNICECRRDKDEIIMSTIEHLEQNIKIKTYE
tara:strand:+ start:3088 stop:3267 length:180 start_codon:yes stop_codon:yes gene_type:complete